MQINTVNNNNTSFNGLFPKRVKKMYSRTMVANILVMNKRDVYERTHDMNTSQLNLMQKMADRYNEMYFNSKNKENPLTIFNILKSITEPKDIHTRVVEKIGGSIESIGELLKLLTDKKAIKYVEDIIKKDHRDNRLSAEFIADILQSPHKEDYISNPNKYRAYLRLNRDDKDMVKKLDALIEDNKYDRRFYEKAEQMKRLDTISVNSAISKENLDKYYSKPGADFIKNFADRYCLPPATDEKTKDIIADIYRTTNENNVSLRIELFNRYAENFFYCKNAGAEIDAMRSVFGRMDRDEYSYKFVEKYIDECKEHESIAALDNILAKVPSPKAFIFRKNIYNIMDNTKPGEERDRALVEEVLNPFYQNKTMKVNAYLRKSAIKSGYYAEEGSFDNLIKWVENIYNKFKYNRLVARKSKQMTVQALNPAETQAVKKKAEYVKPEMKIIEKQVAEKPAEIKNNSFTRAQKLKIEAQQSVREFINKKLHPSIVDEHEKIYANKATKMRVRMLPQILASIKETRADERAAGIKRPKISNYDAVDLYTRINGNNRKLINYMLKIRNSEGKRIFDVQSIIDALGSVHKRVILERMKPAEAKACYEDFYQKQLDTYGKLKPYKNVKDK